MNKEKLKEIEKFVEKNSTEREWIHTRQIRPIAHELAEKEGADKDVVDIAVLFHDLGKAQGGDHGHNIRSEEVAKQFLEKLDLDKTFIQRVCDAVRRHAGPWSGNEMPENIEDKVVFDADMIQQRGPFGITKQLEEFKDLSFVKRVEKARYQLRKALSLVTTKSGKEMLKGKIPYFEDFFKEVLK